MVTMQFLHTPLRERPSRRALYATLRSHLAKLPLAILIAGGSTACLGEVVPGEGPGDSGGGASAARKKFDTALPAMTTACAACHVSGTDDFMAGATSDEKYTKLVGSNVVNFTAPASSRLLTKGLHSGPAFTAEQASPVLEWLNAERDARADGGGGGNTQLATAKFAPALCTQGNPVDNPATCPLNTVALDSIGAVGAKITFVYEQVTPNLAYVSDLTLVAGPNGVFMEHPLFTATDAANKVTPDAVDTFFSTKENLQTGSRQLKGGTVTFPFPPNSQLQILFKSVKVYQPDGGGGGGGGGGCKVVAGADGFTARAKPALNASCTNGACHATNNNAKSAMNLDPARSDQDMCNEVRTRVNLDAAAVDNSGIFVTVRPGAGGHPFAFANQAAHDDFKNPIKIWIQKEITAP